jgi:hypothetical protein
MPLVEADTFETLRAAVDEPETYASGTERQSLKAAFDIASSQITKEIFDFEAETRMMIRSRLNAEKVPDQYAKLIAALKKALAGADPLDNSGGYNDDDEEIAEFIRSLLGPLVKAIEPFQ